MGDLAKAAFDRMAAAALIVLLSPLLGIVSILVLWFHGKPILFRQLRPGKGCEPFWLLKFRTMSDALDDSGNLLSDDARLTRFGRFLRSTSLDELPELVNVLRGEMSLVGPRPLLMRYLDHYTPQQNRRHEVLPGITGWAQVNGRNSLSWERKFDLDVWYVDHRSFGLDLTILLKTLVIVLSRRDVSAEGHATMPAFGRGRSRNEIQPSFESYENANRDTGRD